MKFNERILRKALIAALPASLLLVVAAGLAANAQPASTAKPGKSSELHISTNGTVNSASDHGSESASSLPSATKDSAVTTSGPSTAMSSNTVQVHASNTAGASHKVTINGQDVPLPKSGSVHRTITDSNGTTTVDASVSDNGSIGSDTSSSGGSVNVQVESNTSSTNAP